MLSEHHAQQKGDKSARVVRIIARLNVGGPAQHVVWLSEDLPRAGYVTTLVAGTVPPGEDDMSYFAAEHDIRPVIIPQMSREISPKDALTVWKLYRLFVRLRPDIVHTHTAKAGTVGRMAGALYRLLTFGTRRCQFVHTYHGHIFHSYYGALKTRAFLLIEKTLARLATDRIVVISPQQRREIHRDFGVGRDEQFVTIPLGLDLGLYKDWRGRRSVLRDELRAGDGELLVGIVGRVTEIKNHKLFLDAAALVLKRRDASAPVVRFVIIGDGHLRRELETRALALGISADVVFLGLRNDPENFYPALDVVALTSRNEGTPLTLIEAMANARPIVATAVGGVVDLLGEEACADDGNDSDAMICQRGVLVRAGKGENQNDAEAFCRGLERLIDDAELCRRLGENGRRFVLAQYSKERLASDIVKLYDELLGRRGASSHANQSSAVAAAITPEQRS